MPETRPSVSAPMSILEWQPLLLVNQLRTLLVERELGEAATRSLLADSITATAAVPHPVLHRLLSHRRAYSLGPSS